MPAIADAIRVLLDTILDIAVEYVPKITVAGMKILIGFLQGIADNIQQVVETAVSVITNFLAGIANSIPKIIQSGIDLMLSFINGMADGIRNNTPAVIAATNNLMDAIIGAVKAWFGNIVTKGKELVGKLKEGVKSKFSDMKNAAKDMMDGFIKGVKEKFRSIKNTAVNAIKGAVDGVKSFLGIKSPSRVFAEIGRYSDEGMVKGLTQYAGIVKNAAMDVGEGAVDSMSDALSGVSSIFGSNVDSQPTIRPILDLSDIQNGANRLGGMFGQQTVALAGVGAGVTGSNLSSILSQIQSNNGSSTDNVVSAISELRSDFGDLIHAINHMHIRLDSGTVVGEIIGKIDSGLGQIASHKGRGN
jgi:phage-related protein